MGKCLKRTFVWNTSRNPLQNPIQILQGVSVDQAPSGWITFAQVVGMVQTHTPPWTTVAFQPADMQVQVADCTLCLIFVIFVEALGSISTP